MADVKPKRIGWKYDLMHLNTPSFASAVITWDLSKASKIVKNRVIKWFRQGYTECWGGESKAIWLELRQQLNIPFFYFKEDKHRDGSVAYRLEWEHITDEIYAQLNTIYKTERAIVRLKGERAWNMDEDELSKDQTYLYLSNEHDMTELKKAIQNMQQSDWYRDKVEQGIHFVESGDKLTFTWRE